MESNECVGREVVAENTTPVLIVLSKLVDTISSNTNVGKGLHVERGEMGEEEKENRSEFDRGGIRDGGNKKGLRMRSRLLFPDNKADKPQQLF